MREKLLRSELAKLFQTSKETLRHYEHMNLIRPDCNEKNYKLYGIKEINQLRQVFFLKDLEVPLEDIHAYMYEELDKDIYLEYMRKHSEKVEAKIKHLLEIQKKINHLVNVLEKKDLTKAFSIEKLPERQFYRLRYESHQEAMNPKLFYDRFEKFIEEGCYSERHLMMVYPYTHLSQNVLDSDICIEIGGNHAMQLKMEHVDVLTMPEGMYLTFYYIFEHGNYSLLSDIYRRVESYLDTEGLGIAKNQVLEMEHPEFSMVCKENESIYELQLPVVWKG